ARFIGVDDHTVADVRYEFVSAEIPQMDQESDLRPPHTVAPDTIPATPPRTTRERDPFRLVKRGNREYYMHTGNIDVRPPKGEPDRSAPPLTEGPASTADSRETEEPLGFMWLRDAWDRANDPARRNFVQWANTQIDDDSSYASLTEDLALARQQVAQLQRQ